MLSDSKSSLNIKVSHRTYSVAADAFGELGPIWQQLELKAETHFFLSWAWVESWLRISPLPLLVVEAKNEGQTVGIGLFSQRVTKKFGLIPTRQLWLNRCGDDALDQIWIEYNDCLLDELRKLEARQAIYDYIFSQPSLCDEMYIGLSLPAAAPSFAARKLSRRLVMESQGFCKAIKARDLPDLLAELSKNTRKQIQRSIKLLTSSGDLKVRMASDQQEADKWFERVADLHQRKWRDSEWGSGFDNPYFVTFHRHLLAKNKGECELLALVLDNKPLCFLYNFIDGDRVYFYLSAIPEQSDNRIKLGLVAHTLAMEHYSKLGLSQYDFLAGSSRYKQSLSDESYDMAFRCVYRANLLARIEQWARRIKSRF